MTKKSTISLDQIRFLVTAIYIVTADKGGTGKSFTARAIIDALIEAGLKFTLLECDIGIPDTAKVFEVASGYNIDTPEGWRGFYEAIIAAPKDRPTIVTMPGGFLHRAKTHMPAILKVLPRLPDHLGRPMRVLWVGDDKRDVIESLKDFREETNNQLITDFIKNEHFCPAEMFTFFDGSQEKKNIETNGGQIVRLPALPYRIAQLITNRRLKGLDMMQSTDLLDLATYEGWWHELKQSFRAAGYIP